MESCVSWEHEKSPSLVAPTYLLLTYNGLHDGVETSFGGIQITRHVGVGYRFLFKNKIFNSNRITKKQIKEVSTWYWLCLDVWNVGWYAT